MKVYTIVQYRGGKVKYFAGTLPELLEKFQYTLEKGKAYERERGNKKINVKPKTINSLVKNLNYATDNAAANGFANESYSYME